MQSEHEIQSPLTGPNYQYNDADMAALWRVLCLKLGGFGNFSPNLEKWKALSPEAKSARLSQIKGDLLLLKKLQHGYVIATLPTVKMEVNQEGYHIQYGGSSSNGSINFVKIFNQLVPRISQRPNSRAKILFPVIIYRDQEHWQLFEIELIRKSKGFDCILYVHDPMNPDAQFDRQAFLIFKGNLERALEQCRGNRKLKLLTASNLASPNAKRRQAQDDFTSCGPIVFEDLRRRILGEPLSKEPYAKGAVSLRLDQACMLQNVNEYIGGPNFEEDITMKEAEQEEQEAGQKAVGTLETGGLSASTERVVAETVTDVNERAKKRQQALSLRALFNLELSFLESGFFPALSEAIMPAEIRGRLENQIGAIRGKRCQFNQVTFEFNLGDLREGLELVMVERLRSVIGNLLNVAQLRERLIPNTITWREFYDGGLNQLPIYLENREKKLIELIAFMLRIRVALDKLLKDPTLFKEDHNPQQIKELLDFFIRHALYIPGFVETYNDAKRNREKELTEKSTQWERDEKKKVSNKKARERAKAKLKAFIRDVLIVQKALECLDQNGRNKLNSLLPEDIQKGGFKKLKKAIDNFILDADRKPFFEAGEVRKEFEGENEGKDASRCPTDLANGIRCIIEKFNTFTLRQMEYYGLTKGTFRNFGEGLGIDVDKKYNEERDKKYNEERFSLDTVNEREFTPEFTPEDWGAVNQGVKRTYRKNFYPDFPEDLGAQTPKITEVLPVVEKDAETKTTSTPDVAVEMDKSEAALRKILEKWPISLPWVRPGNFTNVFSNFARERYKQNIALIETELRELLIKYYTQKEAWPTLKRIANAATVIKAHLEAILKDYRDFCREKNFSQKDKPFLFVSDQYNPYQLIDFCSYIILRAGIPFDVERTLELEYQARRSLSDQLLSNTDKVAKPIKAEIAKQLKAEIAKQRHEDIEQDSVETLQTRYIQFYTTMASASKKLTSDEYQPRYSVPAPSKAKNVANVASSRDNGDLKCLEQHLIEQCNRYIKQPYSSIFARRHAPERLALSNEVFENVTNLGLNSLNRLEKLLLDKYKYIDDKRAALRSKPTFFFYHAGRGSRLDWTLTLMLEEMRNFAARYNIDLRDGPDPDQKAGKDAVLGG